MTSCSAAPACTTNELTAWATMSCSSRAIRVRSSTTACIASVAAVISASTARWVAAAVRTS